MFAYLFIYLIIVIYLIYLFKLFNYLFDLFTYLLWEIGSYSYIGWQAQICSQQDGDLKEQMV